MERGCPRDSHQQGYGFLSESLPIKAEMETWVQVIWGESTSERMSGGAGRGEGREKESILPDHHQQKIQLSIF